MNILVTGADGFIGSHLTELLLAEGHSVRALAQYNSFNNWGWLEQTTRSNNLTIITGDVRDPFFCKEITKEIDIVFHLAALIAIPYSYVAPNTYIETNVCGTLNICQASLENGVNRVIHTSTSEVYGTALYVPIDEKHPLQPQSPYSASKIGADAIAMSYYNSFELPLTIARPFNTFGPRQSARAVIPTVITQLLNGYKTISLGDTTPTRDFNYVSETCNGFLNLALSEKAIGETVNIGSNREISIKETVNLIAGILGIDVKIEEESQRIRPEKSEVHRLWCDNSKYDELIGEKKRMSLEEGMQLTIDWFSAKENLDSYKADLYNV